MRCRSVLMLDPDLHLHHQAKTRLKVKATTKIMSWQNLTLMTSLLLKKKKKHVRSNFRIHPDGHAVAVKQKLTIMPLFFWEVLMSM